MRLDWIFLPRENPCAKFYIIIIIIIIIMVVGALGSVSKKLAGHLEQLGIKNRTRTMQKSALLGSAHILRKVLEV